MKTKIAWTTPGFATALLSLLAASAFSPAVAQRPRATAIGSDDVPAAVAERARRIAEASSKLSQAIAAGGAIYINTEVVREKGRDGEATPPLRYQVIHYRYADDAGIVTLVDLQRNAVIEEREVPHLPIMLAAEEFERARGLALADAGVRRALGQYVDKVLVEPLVVRMPDRRDPWYGHRVVRLLFRVGSDYLDQPVVHVDLTDGRVHIGQEEGH